VDGIPVPPGISGSLNELFSPSIANQIEFQTGGWDAEFGNKNAAIVAVGTRIPSGPLHAEGSAFAGSFDTHGENVNLSSRRGQLGFVLSGTHEVTDMRQEPVVLDPASNEVKNFHNHGEDVALFGKMQYSPGSSDVVNLDASWSQTKFQVPYDSTGGVVTDDNQKDANVFVNASWRRRLQSGRYSGSELFAGAFHRSGTLDYEPNLNDAPQFIFFPDTLTPYNLTEHRNFRVEGLKLDGELRLREALRFKVGTLATVTSGHEDFSTLDATGTVGPASNSDLNGSDVGVYAQTELAPTEALEVRAGLRYDTHDAPNAPRQDQVSPRLRLNLYPDPGSTLWLYYGRLFMPTSIENLRDITSVAQAGVVTQPTLPERDDFYELGLLHRFPVGVVGKLSAYYKQGAPGVDDNTVPGSSIVTEVNIAHVKTTGIEGVLEVQPRGPLSGYLNLAVCHAYGYGDITGGFFPTDQPTGSFDLDHDQRWSAVASATWAQRGYFASVTATYGSGLTNGAAPDASYSTALFALNKSIKVDPSTIVAASAGYSFNLGKTVVRPEVFADNLFDRRYLLKGAFFSGASVGRPRSVQVRLKISL
jgi:outer membrane receptor for ferrienterochelin and colicin